MSESPFLRGLGFDETDMQSLRQGVIAPSVKDKLWRRHRRMLVAFAGCMGPGIVFGACLGTAFLLIGLQGNSVLLPVGVLMLVVLGVMVYRFYQQHIGGFNADLNGGRLEMLTDSIAVRPRANTDSSEDFLYIQGHELQLAPGMARELVSGEVYRVYFLPRSKILVAAESA